MFEAIVTLVIPAQPTEHPGLEVEPARTEVYRIEFDTKEAMYGWLDTDPPGEPNWSMRVLHVAKLVEQP